MIEHNINTQTYGNIKEVIIMEDGDTMPLNSLTLQNKSIVVKIMNCKRMSIGEKRNRLIRESTSKYSAFMDTDDIYLPCYIKSSIELLQETKKKLCGSGDMLFYFTLNAKTGIMRSTQINLLHEATMVFDTKFVKNNMKFNLISAGEGFNFISGFEKHCLEHNIYKIMICVQHEKLEIDFAKYGVNIEEHLQILSTLKI
jgi:glycosyltransferase involved in cell wall biosynthesis